MDEDMLGKAGLSIDASALDDIISTWAAHPGDGCSSPPVYDLHTPNHAEHAEHAAHEHAGPHHFGLPTAPATASPTTTTPHPHPGDDDEKPPKKPKSEKSEPGHAPGKPRRKMQSVWGPDGPEIDDTVAPKRQRLFIARQACEICRQKKTRCDGGHPCGLCRSGGLECKYAERKATKNEVSLGMIFNTLQRIESKIEDQQDRDEERRAEKKKQRGRAPKTSEPESQAQPPPQTQAQPMAAPALPVHETHMRRFSSTSSPAVDFASPSGASVHSREGHGHMTSGIHALLSAASPASQTHSQTHSQSHSQSQRAYRPRHVPVIQYAIRQLANWPVIRDMLQRAGNSVDESDLARPYLYDAAAATLLEQRRAPLPVPLLPTNENWLAQLSISTIKDLGDKYFATFNIANPVLDRRLFSQHSLGVAIHTGFGVNIESCVVLVTMALGVLGRKSLRAAGMVDVASPFDADAGGGEDWDNGLVFFNEARKRVGLLGNDTSLQSCQHHLLCGLYYAQLARPIDCWVHVSRAGICCSSFWACVPKDCDEWTMDMQARLFWITAMFEAVVTQELDVPMSNLHNFEERVPLPKFVDYPGGPSFGSMSIGGSGGIAGMPSVGASVSGVTGVSGIASVSGSTRTHEEEQDAFCHYHFLSQIAHRIILTRLYDSLFFNRGKALASGQSTAAVSQATTLARSDYPPQNLEDELLHQLEQWRSQLPGYLQWDDDNAHRYAEPRAYPSQLSIGRTPTDILVVPWLQARYCISRYHLRRPLLHRALHHPDWMTPGDFDKCRDALDSAVRWCSVVRTALEFMDCLYLKYFICTQLFGMLLLFHALDTSAETALRQLVPATYEAWRAFAIGFLAECAPMSPSIARELALVQSLRRDAPADVPGSGSGPSPALYDMGLDSDRAYPRAPSRSHLS